MYGRERGPAGRERERGRVPNLNREHPPPPPPPRRYEQEWREDVEDDFYERAQRGHREEFEEDYYGRPRHGHNENLRGQFRDGPRRDIEKVDQVFSCHDLSEDQKVRYVTLEFTDFALLWWDKVVRDRQDMGEPMVRSWAELKRMMRRRYVPIRDELIDRVHALKQGSKSVEEYRMEMMNVMTRANFREDEHGTMNRFIRGLNYDIRDVIEIQHHVDMETLLHQAIRIERQSKRRGAYRRVGQASSHVDKGKGKAEPSTPWRKEGSLNQP